MNSLATGQNSSNCQEESCTFPVADNYFNLQDIYSLCQGETVNMPYQEGKPAWNKGKRMSEEFCRKDSESHKGKPSPNKGKKYPPEFGQKISSSKKGKATWNKGLKGIHLSPNSEFKKGCVGIGKNKHHTETAKIKISSFRKNYYLSGNPNPMLGKHHTKETRNKMSSLKKGHYIGKDNPMWRGGISFEPYCPKFNKQLKEFIRERDNRTCQLCGIKENGKKLAVHHVHYDKENCEPDLIALCNKCNPKVNSKRDSWEKHFIDLLSRRGLIMQQIFPAWWGQ